MVRPFMDYLARCSHMLRQGWFVADVCYYFGDQAPNFFPESCLVPEKPLLDGLHAGHEYDICSSQVILDRMSVENGRIRDDVVYFIRNKTREPVALTARFRVDAMAAGRTPEFWWPHDGSRTACPDWRAAGDGLTDLPVSLNGKTLGITCLPPFRVEATGALRPGANHLEIRVANLWANRLNGDSLRPVEKRFTRSNLDHIQTDPTSDSSFRDVPRGPTRPVYTDLPPLMKSGLFGPVRIVKP